MLIGLTGGIGSGKSIIAQQLREMGYDVYDTDSQAKRIITEDPLVRQQIQQLLGDNVYHNGIYQTHLVAARIFNDVTLLQELNAIVHPAVKADLLQWASRPKLLSQPQWDFVECAILYQSGIGALCHRVVAVTAPEQLRMERVIARDKSDIDKVRARMRVQKTQEDLLHADIVINNDGQTPIPTLCLQLLNNLKV